MTSPTPLQRILPVPRTVEERPGHARIRPGAPLTVASAELLPSARLLAERLEAWAGIAVASPVVSAPAPGGIHLAVAPADELVATVPPATGVAADGADLGDERSALTLAADGIRVVGAAPAGVHRAVTTLAALAEQGERDAEGLVLPAAAIADGPHLAWRGLSFDVVRATFTKQEVLRVIELLDRYRMNVLHLHLTDDQGWRIEIPSRPELTPPGSAHFTQAEFREIVEFAQERFITVVPEIDLPGHSSAALVAYPEMTRSGTAWAFPSDPMQAIALMASGEHQPQYLDPEKDEVWAFVDDVVSAVAALTPGRFVHIGGDEAFGMPHDEHVAFVQRAREIVRRHGKEPVGWQEAIRADSAPGELVQLWIDGGAAIDGESPFLAALPPQLTELLVTAFADSAADPERVVEKRARVIMSRTGLAYLDAPYAEPSTDEDGEARRARVGMPGYPAVTIEGSATVPIPGIDEPTELDVVGFEAAIWCETVQDFDDLSYLLLPRLPGLAQRAWAPGPARDWADLRVRLGAQAPAWRREGLTFHHAPSIDWRGEPAQKETSMSRVPDGFLWGASTSAHQVEGNNVSSDFWRMEGGGPILAEYSGDADDSYHRYPEDMRLLADAGLNAYRFSIEWARIEPEKGRWSNAQLAHYRRMIDTARSLGLEPVVTLHHFTSPYWFAEAGGWKGDEALERWALYIEKVSAILGDVGWVCTINEPNMVGLTHMFLGAEADALTGGITFAQDGPLMPDTAIGERLVEAHRLATRILRKRTSAKVGWTIAQQAFTPTEGNEAMFEKVNWAWEDLFLEASRDDDFVGVQSYTTQPVGADGPVPHPPHPDNTITGWAYRPDALGIALRHAHDVTGKPLLVTENGIAIADDTRRIEYTREALRHLAAAVEDGIDVRGYLHWSALDNYEWGHWAPTFGLIAVDRETFERRPKPSLAWLGEVARTNAAEIPAGTTSFAPGSAVDGSTTRHADALARLTLEQKVRLLTGASVWSLHGESAIGLRGIVVSDGPTGVRGQALDDRAPSASLPSATSIAASWDLDRLRSLGRLIAAEARSKGVDVVLGPTINLHRSPRGGRHFEAFSEDPWLTGTLASTYVEAVQAEGVGVTPKHYVANDSETDRHTVDVRVDERTLRELYLAPFERAVASGAWMIMSSYNQVNGNPATANELLASPLKDEWGFDGVVISDWGAVTDTVRSAASAQDLVMPGPDGPWGDALLAAIRAGEIDERIIDDKVARLLQLAERVGALDASPRTETPLPWVDEDIATILREAAADGMVLARNTGLLPLADEGQRIAVIGHHALVGRGQGGGSASVFPPYQVSPLDGIRAAFPKVTSTVGVPPTSDLTRLPAASLTHAGGSGVEVSYLDADGSVFASEIFPSGRFAWFGDANLAMAAQIRIRTTYVVPADGPRRLGVSGLGGLEWKVDGKVVFSGRVEPVDGADLMETVLNPPVRRAEFAFVAGQRVPLEVTLSPYLPNGIPFAALILGEEQIFDDPKVELERAVAAARDADIAVVVVGTTEVIESEGYDRASLALPDGHDDLVRAVAAVNDRTIVVVNAGAPVLMPWFDEVAAVVLAWFPGQEFGNALADVLRGEREPGGRMPTTWPRAEADVPVWTVEPADGVLEYAERGDIGYRAWTRQGHPAPLLAFGSGLGYTTWTTANAAAEVLAEGGARVTADVENTGERTGKQVVQAYLSRTGPSDIDRPELWLAGFAVVRAEPGAVTAISIDLEPRAFAHWSVESHAWTVEPGSYAVRLGTGIDALGEAIPVEVTSTATGLRALEPDDVAFGIRSDFAPRTIAPVVTVDHGRDASTGPIPTAASPLGDLLDHPVTRSVIEQTAPDLATHPMLGMIKAMPLATVLTMAAGQIPAETVQLLTERLAAVAD
ncbi:family 1 glycosylhydrolase [Microbacterium sp. ASV81]|uniref:Family 1 glycosylhydrolase n=1 Tax=Microbacterium capsulatum TaxID=3041921 RepID=A0ABU0XIF2_9MICO|nr:family 1 glycosylhydrolase [Microbacterium sp. ASV81]MDQ4214915.1 family 1 glycosylhydrolase [Microbacterium sp. ASV81]